MATTHTLIAKHTFSSSTITSISFTNIPQTYTDLRVVFSVRGMSTSNGGNVDSVVCTPYNNSTAGTRAHSLSLYSSGATTATDTTNRGGFTNSLNSTANGFSCNEINIPNYTSSVYKAFEYTGTQGMNVTSNSYLGFTGVLWNMSTAINRLDFSFESAGAFAANSTIYLYGISASATQGTLQVYGLGGDNIKTDGTYWYHAFTKVGTSSFTPAKNITADILVVGGGGGSGGYFSGGGGGAGGVLAFASQGLLANTPYTVTVGTGGYAGGTAAGSNAGNGDLSQFGSLTAAIGGGYGGNGGTAPTQAQRNGASGASGGGGGGDTNPGTGGTGTQGYNGATGTAATQYQGGGGGGAGGAASNINGGPGVSTVTNWGSLSTALTVTGLGVSGYIAGGGGGGSQASGVYGTGGSGGGGNGTSSVSQSGQNGLVGLANSGSGAGGGGGGSVYGSIGGSGVVIIRYPV
jgi:hypothetical protein